MAKRKATSDDAAAPQPKLADESPFDYLVRLYLDESARTSERIAAASALLPFTCRPLTPVEGDDLPDDDGDEANSAWLQ